MNTHTTGMKALLAGLAAGSLLLTAACGSGSGDKAGSGDDNVLRVGLMMSTTGPAAPFGISERNGARVVLDDINDRGGINGVKIKIFEADDKSDPTEAAQQARKLILQDKVNVMIGTTAGGNTLAYAPIAASNKIPVISPNGSIGVTDKANSFWPWVYRASASEQAAAKRMIGEVIKEGHVNLGVFAEETAYGDEVVKYLNEGIKENGGGAKITVTARAAATATDFSSQATKLKNAKPDVVMLVTSAPAIGAGITRAIRQTGFDIPIWGMTGLAQEGFLKAAGSAAEGVRMTATTNWNDPSAGEKQLLDLLEKSGYKGTSYETAGSNAAQVLEAAANKVKGAYTGVKLQTALSSLQDVKVYGRGESISYTKDERDGLSPDSLALLIVKDGKFANYTP